MSPSMPGASCVVVSLHRCENRRVGESNAYDEIISGEARDPYLIVVAVPEPIDVEARLVEAGYPVANGEEAAGTR